MTNAAIQAVLALIQAILPLVNSSSTVASILNTLTELLPIVVQEASDLIQPIKNIIAALSANPATTADQLAALQALDQQADAAFDSAAAAYEAAHPAPGTPAA